MLRKFLILLTLLAPISAFAAGPYYVDSSATGSTKAGTAANPACSLYNLTTAIRADRAAAGSADIIVYFSARQASTDANEVYTGNSGGGCSTGASAGQIDLLALLSTTSSTHYLILDGQSKYNTDTTNGTGGTGSWADYSGSSKAETRTIYSQNSGHNKISYIKLKGINVVANVTKGVAICGDHTVVQNIEISHTMASLNTGQVGLLIVPTADGSHEGSGEFCPVMDDVQILNNYIHDTDGEGIYVGGGGCSSADSTGAGAGCQGFPAHTNVIVDGNTINCSGCLGNQGDGIDIKGGLVSLRVSNNTITAMQGTPRCIVTQGARNSDPDPAITIYNNTCYNSGVDDSGIVFADSWGTPRGITTFNNKIYGLTPIAGGAGTAWGIRVYSCTAPFTIANNVIYNNNNEGLVLGSCNATIKNNALLANKSSGAQTSLSGTYTSTNNAYGGSWVGTCTSCQSGLASGDFVSVSTADFRPANTSSKLYVNGADLTSLGVTELDTDFAGNNRPNGGSWDIGAYQLLNDTTPPTPGSSGTISAGSITTTSAALTWAAGTDDLTPQASLQYQVYKSQLNNIDTVANAEANGTIVQAYTANLTSFSPTGLSPANSYYFNVIIKDGGGNKAAYTSVNVNTLSDTTAPVPGNSGTIATSGVNQTSMVLDWTAATDDTTPSASLQYEVCRSGSNNISSVSACKAATIIQSYTANLTSLLASGLSRNTTYYFNVLVKDGAGNEALYTTKSQATTNNSAGGAGRIKLRGGH